MNEKESGEPGPAEPDDTKPQKGTPETAKSTILPLFQAGSSFAEQAGKSLREMREPTLLPLSAAGSSGELFDPITQAAKTFVANIQVTAELLADAAFDLTAYLMDRVMASQAFSSFDPQYERKAMEVSYQYSLLMPSGVEPFLTAIARDPRDNTARIVLADWLDERDEEQSEAYRTGLGNWVRAHTRLRELISHSKGKAMGIKTSPEFAAVKAVKEEWEGRIPAEEMLGWPKIQSRHGWGYKTGAGYNLVYGFPSVLHCRYRSFLDTDACKAIFRFCPITYVVIGEVSWSIANAVLGEEMTRLGRPEQRSVNSGPVRQFIGAAAVNLCRRLVGYPDLYVRNEKPGKPPRMRQDAIPDESEPQVV